MDTNQIIVIDLPPEARMRLNNQILRGMEDMDLTAFYYKALDLGFDLPVDWPLNPAVEITLAQIVVLTQKLNMRLTIGNLNLSPMPNASATSVPSVAKQ